MTPDGVIVLENVPKDAEVFVDGSKITLSWPGIGKPIIIRVVPGERKVEVKKDGFKTFGEVVSVTIDGSEEISVRLEPVAADRSGRNETQTAPSEDESPRTKAAEHSPQGPDGATPATSVTNSIGMKLKLIPAGTFLMGASADAELTKMHPVESERARPAHTVRISRSFYIGEYEVTQEQYQATVALTPSRFGGNPNLPVDSVSWYEAIEFCNRLSEKESRRRYYQIEGQQVSIVGGDGYRLPTEAEWEYACRGGTQTIYPHGDDWERIDLFAWTGTNSGKQTHPVGELKPNRFGLYDMTGNVFEWCWDWYGKYPDDGDSAEDPKGPATGTSRVSRGCAYTWNTRLLFSSLFRGSSPNFQKDPGVHLPQQGFRVARGADETIAKRGDVSLLSDTLKVGSVWIGDHERIQGDVRETFPMTLTVLKREGEEFQARYEAKYRTFEIRGTIKNGKISWLAKDVKAIKGKPGHDTIGTIHRNEMSLRYSGLAYTDGKAESGTYTLRLEK
jgi:formylglycine-generating enzyme required for sulfatase activity